MVVAQQARFMTRSAQSRSMQATTIPATASTQLDISFIINLMLPMLMIAMMTKMMAGVFGEQGKPEAIQ